SPVSSPTICGSSSPSRDGRAPPHRAPERRPEAPMPPIRLIRIDAELQRRLDSTQGDFETAYGASLGGERETIREVVAQTLAMIAKTPREPIWGGYLSVDRDNGRVIGTCGFKHGPEKDGRVEIAYFTFAPFEGKGYATAMAQELV